VLLGRNFRGARSWCLAAIMLSHTNPLVCTGCSRDLRIGRLRSNRIPNRIGRYNSNLESNWP